MKSYRSGKKKVKNVRNLTVSQTLCLKLETCGVLVCVWEAGCYSRTPEVFQKAPVLQNSWRGGFWRTTSLLCSAGVFYNPSACW